jgi:hypothetical protein
MVLSAARPAEENAFPFVHAGGSVFSANARSGEDLERACGAISRSKTGESAAMGSMPPGWNGGSTMSQRSPAWAARPGRIVPDGLVFIGVPTSIFVDPRGKCLP